MDRQICSNQFSIELYEYKLTIETNYENNEANKEETIIAIIDTLRKKRHNYIQRSQKWFVRGCEKFVLALAYLSCPALPGSCLARFTNLFWEL